MENEKKISDYMENDVLDINQIMEDFTPYIKKIITNMNSKISYEDIEEILVDVSVAIWKNQNTEIQSLKAYISGTVKNITHQKIKKNKDHDSLENREIGTYDNISSKQDLKLLEVAIRNLKELDRDIVYMYYFENTSIKEIAYCLDMTVNAIKKRLSRARKKIQEMYLNPETIKNIKESDEEDDIFDLDLPDDNIFGLDEPSDDLLDDNLLEILDLPEIEWNEEDLKKAGTFLDLW